MTNENTALWAAPGGAIIMTTAQKEFDISEAELITAIKAGKLNYRRNTLYGNPAIKLLRSEVEQYVIDNYGINYLGKKKLEVELAKVKTEINSAKRKVTAGEKRKAQLLLEIAKFEKVED